MNANKVLLNTMLALAITGIGNACAAEPAQAQTQVQDRETMRAEHREEMSGMTAEQREQYRAEKRSEMTDEQRAAMRAEHKKKKAEQKKLKAEKKNAKKNAEKGHGTKLRDGSGEGMSEHGTQGGMGR